MSAEIVVGLLDDMEEEFTHFGCFALYQLGWSLRDGRAMTDEMRRTARSAYDEFTRRHATRLVWARWPIDLSATWPVMADEPLEFDSDPDGPVDEPLQVLVPR